MEALDLVETRGHVRNKRTPHDYKKTFFVFEINHGELHVFGDESDRRSTITRTISEVNIAQGLSLSKFGSVYFTVKATTEKISAAGSYHNFFRGRGVLAKF